MTFCRALSGHAAAPGPGASAGAWRGCGAKSREQALKVRLRAQHLGPRRKNSLPIWSEMGWRWVTMMAVEVAVEVTGVQVRPRSGRSGWN